MNWIGASDVPREHVFVPDAMRIAIDLAHREEAYGERFLFSGGGPLTGRRADEFAAEHMGRDVKLRAASPCSFVWSVSSTRACAASFRWSPLRAAFVLRRRKVASASGNVRNDPVRAGYRRDSRLAQLRAHGRRLYPNRYGSSE